MAVMQVTGTSSNDSNLVNILSYFLYHDFPRVMQLIGEACRMHILLTIKNLVAPCKRKYLKVG